MAHRIATGLLALLLIGGGLWWSRQALMEWSLQQLLSRTSLSMPKFSGLSLGLDQGGLDEIEFGIATEAGLVTVELQDATADYALSEAKLETISVAHARLKFTYHPANKAETQASEARFQLPLQRLSIKQLDLEVDTPWGVSRFAGRTEIKHGDAGILVASFQDTKYAIRLAFGGDLRTAKAIVERLAGGKVFELNANQLDHANQQASLDANAGSLLEWLTTSELMPESWRARVAASDSPELRPGIASIRLQLTADAHANFDSAEGRLLLTRDASYLASADMKMLNGTADIDGHLDMSAKDAFELIRPWLPVSVSGWQLSLGSLRGTVKLDWQPQRSIAGTAHMTASDVGLTAGSARIEHGHLELDSQDIAHRSMSVSMDVPKLGLGKETVLRNLAFKAQLLESELTLERATLPMFGGVFEVLPSTVNIDQRPIFLTIGVQNVDLSQLLDSLNYPALSGSGSISGKLPLRIDADTIEMEGGVLKGMRPGVLKYQGPVADNENIAFKALRNLMYHSLQAQVNYRPNGDYHLGLRLEGSNPEILSGHPLAFNLNLSGQLPELLKNSMLVGDFDQSILEQVTTKPANTQKPAEPSPSPR